MQVNPDVFSLGANSSQSASSNARLQGMQPHTLVGDDFEPHSQAADRDTEAPVQQWSPCSQLPTVQRSCVSPWESTSKCHLNMSVSFQSWAFSFGGLSVILLISYSNPLGRNLNWTARWTWDCCQPCYHLRHSHPPPRRDLCCSKFPA